MKDLGEIEDDTPHPLKIASCMADNAAVFAREVAAFLSGALGHETAFIDTIPWRERERRLYAGAIHLCWICGLPYVRQSASPDPRIELLAAPIMAAPRYNNRPVYFSDIVVPFAASATGWDDLDGTRIAYNEPNSHSGYNVLCHALDAMRTPKNFFSQVIESGAHQVSIDLLLHGLADVAVIDSTVFETELGERSALQDQLRVIGTLGPSPMPPWVVCKGLVPRLKAALLQALLGMHEHPEGRQVLERARVARFAAVTDAWYDPIRDMAERAAEHPLQATHFASQAQRGYGLRSA